MACDIDIAAEVLRGIEEASAAELPEDQAAPGAPWQPPLPPAGGRVRNHVRHRAQPSVPLGKSKVSSPQLFKLALDAEIIFG
jgi:hypothetical protein